MSAAFVLGGRGLLSSVPTGWRRDAVQGMRIRSAGVSYASM
jgi:hypothetical protein